MDEVTRSYYAGRLQAEISGGDEMLRQLSANLRTEWDALSPEEQELRTLRARVRELEHIIDHARRALNGYDCDEW